MLCQNLGAKEVRDQYTVFDKDKNPVRYIQASIEELLFKVGDDETYSLGKFINEDVPDIRLIRNQILADSDWTQFPDSPLSDSKKSEWVIYRQALRDIPYVYADAISIDDIIWPTKPE
jgi:hypothetical protein